MRTSFLLRLAAIMAGTVVGAAAEPRVLLDASRLSDWEFVEQSGKPLSAVVRVAPDGVFAITGQPVGYLQTKTEYRDYALRVEWRWTGKPGNGGVLVHIASGAIDRKTWPRCLQVQLKHTRAGDLLPMAGAHFAEALSTPPGAPTPQRERQAAASERPAGEWNRCDVLCRGGAIEVRVNGVLQNRVTGCEPAAGRIGLQLEGAPFEVRHVTIEPLASGSAPTESR